MRIRDYSMGPAASAGAGGRKKGKAVREPARSGWLLKMTGLMVTVAMLVGLGSSLWLGWQIRRSLAELSTSETIRKELIELNRELSARHKALISLSHIEAIAAARLDLHRPAASQIRRP